MSDATGCSVSERAAVASPFEPLERRLALHTPVTRAFALGLVVLNLAVLGWMFVRQNEALDRMESTVNGVQSEVPTLIRDQVATADPETCWLIGALGQGMDGS